MVGNSGIANGAVYGDKLADGGVPLRALSPDVAGSLSQNNLLPMGGLRNGSINTSGAVTTDNSGTLFVSDLISIEAGETYTIASFSVDLNDMWVAIAFYDGSGNVVSERYADTKNQSRRAAKTVAAPSTAAYARCAMRLYDDGCAAALYKSSSASSFATSLKEGAATLGPEKTFNTSRNIVPLGLLEIGYVYTSGNIARSTEPWADNFTTDFFAVKPDTLYTMSVSGDVPDGRKPWVAVCFYDDGMSLVGSRTSYEGPVSSGFTAYSNVVTSPSGAAYARMSARMFGTCVMAMYEGTKGRLSPSRQDIKTLSELGNQLHSSKFVRSIVHRGWYLYPENTLVAFGKSKEIGFDAVEMDIRLTADSVPVLLHDDTINRTARNQDGTSLSETISISSLTLAQAREYDFGIYRDAIFAGTDIPTFAEALDFCRRIGVEIYADLKVGTASQAIVLMDMANAHGMRMHVSWFTDEKPILSAMREHDPMARIGLLNYGGTPTQEDVDFAASIASSLGESFILAQSVGTTGTTDAIASMCQASFVQLELWNVLDQNRMKDAMHPYVTGVESDYYQFGKYQWLGARDYL